MSYSHKINSPFLLENETDYKKWRNEKLSLYPESISNLLIQLNKDSLLLNDLNSIKKIIGKYNFAVYEFNSKIDDEFLQEFCKKLKLIESVSNPLSDINNISNITDNSAFKSNNSNKTEYIPYTNKKLNWHTDGYYYPINISVKSFLLHCESQAEQGGRNFLIDHEIIYIFLRDHNPDYIDILMQKDIMEIPRNKNIKDSKAIKGPVFYIDKDGSLNMRFTSRKQNIIWKKDDIINDIKRFIESFINDDKRYIFDLLLKENQGYIANNILHRREEFNDGKKKRLLKRIRFLNRVS
tara:strand:+ start:28 stop:912 length:885 start_codon:yes stop_codon:yes gene_type:complete